MLFVLINILEDVGIEQFPNCEEDVDYGWAKHEVAKPNMYFIIG